MTDEGILVTGAAGYVGSAIARRLAAEGIPVVALDDLSTGHRAALPSGMPFVQGDFADPAALARALDAVPCAGTIHCAALSLVEESTRLPDRYRDVNFRRAQGLVRALQERGIRRFLFSSTAAVYGEPKSVPIDESHPIAPANPYGESKAAFERFLDGESEAGRLARVSLRYFNAAGASPGHGEDHPRETHLVPRLLASLRDGLPFTIFGDDYDTVDGTCVRDLVHVEDLAEAHVAAWRMLGEGRQGVFNLGTGKGATVRQVADLAARVAGRPARLVSAPRRAGDPARLVASFEKARRELGWAPRRDLAAVIESAWRWHSENPRGYGEG